MGWGLVGVAPGLVGQRPHEVPAAGDQPEADGLGLQGFLGQDGTRWAATASKAKGTGIAVFVG